MARLTEQLLLADAGRHLRAGNLAAAEAACQELLGRDQRDVAALQMLAAVAFERGAYADAAAGLERCVALRPRDPDLHCNLAKAWASQGMLDRALASFDRALRVRRGHADAIAGKADLLERRGDHAEAAGLLEPSVVAGTEDAAMAVVWSKLKRRDGDTDAAIEIATRHLDEPDLTAGTRRQLWFVRARALERSGAVDEAFDAYRRGNEVGARPFDAVGYAGRIDELCEVFSAEGMAGLPRAPIDSELAVFIVGMPRTGSTLVERIVDAHPRAFGAGEIAALPELVNRLVFELGAVKPYPVCMGRMTDEAARRLGRDHLERLTALGGDADRVADKYLQNYEHLGLINVLLPRARVIHCRRDPLDTCLSCYTQTLSPAKHPYASDLRDLGLAYRAYERLMDHWRHVLDLPLLEVDYEAVVTDPEGQSRRVIDFLGLDWDDACLRFHESQRHVMTLSYDQVRRPVYRDSVGRAKRFEARLGPLREALEK